MCLFWSIFSWCYYSFSDGSTFAILEEQVLLAVHLLSRDVLLENT